MTRPRPVIAIDGPAGAGKSTVAMLLAERLDFLLVDTGALYRAVALIARERGVDFDDGPALGALGRGLSLRFIQAEEGASTTPGSKAAPRLFCGARDISDLIRTPEISMGSSAVSKHPEVREALLDLQRELGRAGGVVLEGRDIGTVVFPDAETKVFLTAGAEARARRRVEDLAGRGIAADFDQTLADIQARDVQDSTRPVAPLRPADDAIIIDTTDLDIEDVVERLAAIARSKGAQSLG
jgi:CMP/dCMP kinase